GPATTVRLVLPVTEPSAAAIVVVPVAPAVASPPAVTVAAPVFDEFQVTWLVRFCVLASEYLPVAVNCCVPPTVTVGVAGVTAVEVSAGGGGAALAAAASA